MSLVSFAVRGNVGIITLNAPKALNALSFEMGREFRTLVDVLSHTLTTPPESLDPIVAGTFPPPSSTLEIPPGSSGVNAVVLTGSGRAFSAGGSLDFLYSRTGVPPHVNASIMHNFYTNFLAVRSLPVPVVAAVNGAAIGAGACVTLAADYRIAKPSAVIGFNFTKLGIHPGMGGSHFLPKLIGSGPAAKMLLGGGRVKGGEAKAMGLVDELVDEEEEDGFLDAAVARAGTFADNSPVAVRGMTKTLRMAADQGLEEALRREADQQALCYARMDWKEGLDAVSEKRDPSFNPYFQE